MLAELRALGPHLCSHPGSYLESLPAEQRGPLWGIPFAVKVSRLNSRPPKWQ